jgi:hypothetical protein
MKSIIRTLSTLLGAALLTLVGNVAAADERAYAEGAVWDVASIRTQDGMFDDYAAWLAGPWKQFMDAQKKAGIILDYKVFAATPRGPNDPDLYLVTVFRNMAALDDLMAKTDPIGEKIFGNMQKANADTVARGKLRTVLGSETIRELTLK